MNGNSTRSVILVAFAICVSFVSAGEESKQLRTWTDESGEYSVSAEFVRFQDGKVHLRLESGKTVSLSSAKLSKADQVYVRKTLADRRSSPRVATPTPGRIVAASNSDDTAPPPSRDKSSFYQLIDIQRQPKHSVSGLEIAQQIQYSILSHIEVGELQSDQKRQVIQYILQTQLTQADDLSRATFGESLSRLRGTQFTYKFNDRNELVAMAGFENNLKANPVKMNATQGFLMTSIIDRDGWKELIGLTFFLPDERGRSQWQRSITHDWQPLGTWSGTTGFVARPQSGDLDRVDYKHSMYYIPPRGQDNRLPFRITNSDFRTQTASGTILFDTERQRVTQVKEQFHVRGSVAVDLLGNPVNVAIEEKQLMTIRLFDEDPRKRTVK